MGGINFNTGGGSSFDPANPGAIGGTTPSTGAFTEVTSTVNALGAATSAGASLLNNTAATSGAPHQWSPSQVFSGTRWDGAASEVVQSRWVQMSPDPVLGSGFGLVLQTKQGAGAWTNRMSIDNQSGVNALSILRAPSVVASSSCGIGNTIIATAGFGGANGGVFFTSGAGLRAAASSWPAPDAFFQRAAAATWQLGQDHATTATAQRIQAHGVGVGTGASLTLGGGSGDTKGDVILDGGNRSAYIASPSATEIRDILISHGLMAAS
jgi:hypothetical protein